MQMSPGLQASCPDELTWISEVLSNWGLSNPLPTQYRFVHLMELSFSETYPLNVVVRPPEEFT